MRTTILCLATLFVAASVGGQSEEADPYSINFVQKAMKLHAQGIAFSAVEKNIPRRGDQTSIALLKILSDAQLSDSKTIEVLLPLIRQSFSDPRFISNEVDKEPKVTLFLLNHLQDIPDARVREEVQKTIDFVKAKTAPETQKP
jgi:hypothetical protein